MFICTTFIYIRFNDYVMPTNFTTKQLFLSFVVMLLSVSFHTTAQVTYYVDSAHGNDAFAGTSWGTAFRNVTRAVTAAAASTAPEVSIWIAQGTYTPIEGIATLPADLRDTAFSFYRGDGIGRSLKVYGGFAGVEVNVNDRDAFHSTYLEGNIATGLFSYHVVVIAGLAATSDSVIIDGITIRHGNAVGSSVAKTYNGVATDSRAGSGIYLSSAGSSKLALRNCKFVTNYNARMGGGVYMANSNPLVADCSFISNSALGAGAGMYVSSSTPRIIHCSFVLNDTKLYSMQGFGGAIYNLSSSPNIIGCTFTSNQVYGQGDVYGGVIYNSAGSDPLIDSCIFISNQARGHSTTARAYGGVIHNRLCSPTITNCVFENNVAYGMGASLAGPGPAYGGVIYNRGGAAIISNCKFTANSVVSRGYMSTSAGNGYAYGGAICNMGAAPVITNCTFTSDTAIGHMGVPSIGGFNGYGYGGAIYDSASTPVISNCTFDANRALGGYGYDAGYGFGYGGAICNASLTVPVSISSCRFQNNRSNNDGGAIYQTLKKLTVTNSLFSNNMAKTGGAIALRYIYLMHFTAYDNVFTGNQSTASGGGAINIDNGGGEDTMINNLFVNNTDAGGLGGGAILITRGVHYIFNNTFYANNALAGGTGGAIHVVSVPVSGTFANNLFNSSVGTGAHADTALAVIGSYTFTNNLFSTTDPLFRDPSAVTGPDGIWRTADDGLQLTACSPARNAGLNAYVVPGELSDITGTARIKGLFVDIGAYESNAIGAITGAHDLCVGGSATLTDTTAGGVWISTNPAIATVSSAGLVTGISPGLDTIFYTVTSPCGVDTAMVTFSVYPASYAGTLTGSSSVCVGDTTILTGNLTGGTWSASNTNATVMDGIVTGVAAGTVIISYSNSCAGAFATIVVTVNDVPPVATVTGASVICIGTSVTLTASVAGGTWSVVNPVAIVSGGGVVTGLTIGIDTVIYTLTNTCGTSTATKEVSVSIVAPSAGVISGAASVCVGSSTVFSDPVPGGVWSTAGSYATVSSTGIVTGIAAGVDTVIYTVSSSCGSASAYRTITVNPLPSAGTLSGPSAVCVGATITLSPSVPAGLWTVTNATATVLAGVVTGVSVGIDTIAYTVINMCGTATATYVVTIDVMPDAGTLSGPDSVCIGDTILLASTVAGGTWGSSNMHSSVVAGMVSGLSEGMDTIYYAVAGVCSTATVSRIIRIVDCAAAVPQTGPAAFIPIRVYPNPAHDQLVIENAAGLTLYVTDICGRRMSAHTAKADNEVFQIADLLPGVYLLVFADHEGARHTVRFIKQ